MAAFSPYSLLAQSANSTPPVLALILGSGLGGVATRLKRAVTAGFEEIPGMTGPAVAGHGGRILLGDWIDRRVLVFEGRLHYYEGHSWDEVTCAVRTAFALGAKTVLFTNAAGGIGDALTPGSLMAIRDHFEWNRSYAWRHSGPGGIGNPRPSPYSVELLGRLDRAAEGIGLALHHGIYAGVTGPCYETPAEIRALRVREADAVGMSTTREVDAAHGLGMRCAAVSCITNRAAGLSSGLITHDDVLLTTTARSELLADLIQEFVCML